MKNAARTVLGLTALVSLATAGLFRWLEFGSVGPQGGVVLPKAVLAGLGCVFALAWVVWLGGLIRVGLSLGWKDRICGLALGVVTLLSFGGVWYAKWIPEGFHAWELRPAMRMFLFTQAVLWGAEALRPALVRLALGAGRRLQIDDRSATKGVLVAAAGAVIITCILAVVILDGIPHMSDEMGYLFQGRILMQGKVFIEQPMYPELFNPYIHLTPRYDKFFHIGQAGWSVPLGLADALEAPWAANVVLTGLVVWLTYSVVAVTNGKRLGAMSAIIVAMTPWMWSHGSTQMTHVNSTVCLLLMLRGFLGLMHAERSSARLGWAAVGGLSLGWAVFVRLPDSVFFTGPLVLIGLVLLARDFRRMWLAMCVFVLSAVPGIGAYLWVNYAITGSSLTSTYGSRPDKVLADSTPSSPWAIVLWLQESWARLNQHWVANAFPVAVPSGLGLWLGWDRARKAWVSLLCSASFLLGYGLFRFQSRPWVGPRWYAPLVPALAFLVACALDAAVARLGNAASKTKPIAERTLAWCTLALLVAFLVAVPLRWLELIKEPPHQVAGKVVEAAEHRGLKNAVVALWGGGEGAYPPEAEASLRKDGKEVRAAMWAMQLPFESNDVIYVWRQPEWKQKSLESWPGRELYVLSDELGDFTFEKVDLDSSGR